MNFEEVNMNCPKCNYDMYYIYEKVLDTGKDSRYCNIINCHTMSSPEVIGGMDWDIKCICPKCKTKWITSDCDY